MTHTTTTTTIKGREKNNDFNSLTSIVLKIKEQT